MTKRVETDSLGEYEVPADALYGSHTARAAEHEISDEEVPGQLIRGIALVKAAAAEANRELGKLDGETAEAVIQAAEEVADGEHAEHFILSPYQTGSGTSTNMNVNEVVANRAAEILGLPVGVKEVHPNDDVNMSQSSNDVVPTGIHVAVLEKAREELYPGLERLAETLRKKEEEFEGTVKAGRTHLQDAAPVTLGQEFSGYAAQVEASLEALKENGEELKSLAIGGTAVGTGLNAPEEFPGLVAERLTERLGIEFSEAENHFAAQAAHDPLIQFGATLKRTAASTMKVADDFRLLVSGPRTGIHELEQPQTQPGSSIMPGKINPVAPESVLQACAQVYGLEEATSLPAAGELELDLTKTLKGTNVLRQVELLTDAARVLSNFAEELEAEEVTCRENARRTLALATALNTEVGYDRAAEAAKRALNEERNLTEVVIDMGLMSREDAEERLDPSNLT